MEGDSKLTTMGNPNATQLRVRTRLPVINDVFQRSVFDIHGEKATARLRVTNFCSYIKWGEGGECKHDQNALSRETCYEQKLQRWVA